MIFDFQASQKWPRKGKAQLIIKGLAFELISSHFAYTTLRLLRLPLFLSVNHPTQQNALHLQRAEAERLRKENDAVHRKFQDLAAQIKESRQEAEEAKRTLTIGMNDMEQKLKRTTNAVHEQAKSQIERLRSSLVEADKAAASEASLAKSRINTLRQENQLFQRDLTQARATITSLTEQVTEGTQAAKSLAQEQAAHLKTVKRASELSQHLEESKQRLAAVEAQFKSKVSELDSSAQSSSATATAQNLAIRTLQAKLDGTLEELASARARGKSLAAALAKSQAKVERAEKSASAAHTALESLRDELAREHSSSVALAVRNDDLRAKNMKLEAQVKELKAGPPITPLGGLRTPSLNRYRAR